MKKQELQSNDGRQLALEALTRVEQDGAYANRVLHTLFSRLNPPAQVRAQTTDWVYGTLRHLTRLDHLMNQLLSKPVDQQIPWVRNLLRLALYQLGPGELPAYAVVDEAVKLAKFKGHDGVARFVNGVLRNYLRRSDQLHLPSFSENPRDHLIIAHSHPDWLIDRWLTQWTPEQVHALVRVNNLPAPLTLRVNTLKSSTNHIIESLDSSGLSAQSSGILPEAIRLNHGSGLERLQPLIIGEVIIQDLGAMLVSHLLHPVPASKVVDLCAAPGTKTTHLAQLMGDAGTIWAVDQYEAKTGLIRDSASRMGLASIHEVTADARHWSPPELVDAVLLDAPCSGTGVIRRRPDLRWRRTPQDLDELSTLQRELLSSAAKMLRPGGCLVYSTCSIQAEENEAQIRWFLGTYPDFQRDIDPSEFLAVLEKPGLLVETYPEGHLLLPSEQTDGFFMSRLVKRG